MLLLYLTLKGQRPQFTICCYYNMLRMPEEFASGGCVPLSAYDFRGASQNVLLISIFLNDFYFREVGGGLGDF